VTPARRAAGPRWSGLLLLDKPSGPTSHDLVARARRRLGERSIGHLGTLDPGASGLLVLVVGAATRCATVWQGGRKTYAGTARWGVVTDTQDLHGQVLASSDARPDEAAVRAAALTLTGAFGQVPPMVSAIKQGGEKLLDLARRGETVERAPRPIEVDAWRWSSFTRDEAAFEVDCSGGTYVRTLVHDLGARLGCGAALAALRRLRSAPFTVERACPADALESLPADEVLARWGVPLDEALAVLPTLSLDEAAARAVGLGQAPRVAPQGAPLEGDPRGVVFRDASGRALALGRLTAGPNGVQAQPSVVFPWAVAEGSAA
jgi:tRNA pseudouridine55 synthase